MCLGVHVRLCVCVCSIHKYTLSYHKVLGQYIWISGFFFTLIISSGTGSASFETFRFLLYFYMHLMCTFYIFKIYYSLTFTKPAIIFYLTLCFIWQRLSAYNKSGPLFKIENLWNILIMVSPPQFPRSSSTSSPIQFNTFIISL